MIFRENHCQRTIYLYQIYKVFRIGYSRQNSKNTLPKRSSFIELAWDFQIAMKIKLRNLITNSWKTNGQKPSLEYSIYRNTLHTNGSFNSLKYDMYICQPPLIYYSLSQSSSRSLNYVLLVFEKSRQKVHGKGNKSIVSEVLRVRRSEPSTAKFHWWCITFDINIQFSAYKLRKWCFRRNNYPQRRRL